MLGFLAKFIDAENLRQFVLWLLRGLEADLDPELKARLKQYRRDRATVEAEIAVEETAIADASARLAQVQQQRSEVRGQLSVETAALAELKQEEQHIDEEPIKTSNPGDDDLLHRDFRRDSNGPDGNRKGEIA
jgi:hypothetical protein